MHAESQGQFTVIILIQKHAAVNHALHAAAVRAGSLYSRRQHRRRHRYATVSRSATSAVLKQLAKRLLFYAIS